MEYNYINDVLVWYSDSEADIQFALNHNVSFGFAGEVIVPNSNDTIIGVILLASHMRLLSITTQNFLIFHEIGHVKNNHVTKGKVIIRNITHELIADAYAKKYMASENIASIFDELLRICDKITWKSTSYWEFKIRKSALANRSYKFYSFMHYITSLINSK
jgi:hypothetical protein